MKIKSTNKFKALKKKIVSNQVFNSLRNCKENYKMKLLP